MRAALVAALLLSLACGGAPRRPAGYGDSAGPSESPPDVASSAKAKPRPSVPDDVVERAAGSVTAYDLALGEQLGEPALARALLDADAVCLGEEHDAAPHHYLELWTIDLLAERAPTRGLELGVGFEMFQRPSQAALTDYQTGRLDEAGLLEQSQYAERWGFPFAYYRPILESARQHRLSLVALNARREVTREVARVGLDGLERSIERELPKLDLSQREHRASFERAMEGHPGLGGDKLDRYYAAQVVWDETMADQAARWLRAHAPIRRLVILAGRAHCARTAIPDRIERRGGGRVLSVLLATEKPASDASAEFDYALVVSPG